MNYFATLILIFLTFNALSIKAGKPKEDDDEYYYDDYYDDDYDDYYDDDDEDSVTNSGDKNQRHLTADNKPISNEDYDDYYDYEDEPEDNIPAKPQQNNIILPAPAPLPASPAAIKSGPRKPNISPTKKIASKPTTSDNNKQKVVGKIIAIPVILQRNPQPNSEKNKINNGATMKVIQNNNKRPNSGATKNQKRTGEAAKSGNKSNKVKKVKKIHKSG